MGVRDGCLVLEVGRIWIGRGRCVPVGHAGIGRDSVGSSPCSGAVRRLGAVGGAQRSGQGGVGAASVAGGGGQFWPVGTPLEGRGENGERQEPHGSQPW